MHPFTFLSNQPYLDACYDCYKIKFRFTATREKCLKLHLKNKMFNSKEAKKVAAANVDELHFMFTQSCIRELLHLVILFIRQQNSASKKQDQQSFLIIS
jgi:hypothetical protein